VGRRPRWVVDPPILESLIPISLPPETLEGWYAFHQVLSLRQDRIRAAGGSAIAVAKSFNRALCELQAPSTGGWSAVVRVIGSRADAMLVHFRPTLDDLAAVQSRLAREELFDWVDPVFSFLSVTEAGIYHITAELESQAIARGGSVGDAEYQREMTVRRKAEEESAHVRRRLYPSPPADMPYTCFYPMSKRRAPQQNWYALPIAERSRLMQAHGLTGRRYAGRVMQVITGAIGFENWEWGVTLFAKDPLDFKRLVTDMRFDEVSANYAEFGEFFVGRLVRPDEWAALVLAARG